VAASENGSHVVDKCNGGHRKNRGTAKWKNERKSRTILSFVEGANDKK
jgi:hypothetical protein